MSFSADIIASRVSQTIRSRGRSYINRVEITKTKSGSIQATVYGTYRYNTSINKNSKGKYIDRCDCPYGETCKHTVALAYVIENNPTLISILDTTSTAIKGPLSSKQLMQTLEEIDRVYYEKHKYDRPPVQLKENHGLYYRFKATEEYGRVPYSQLAIETGRYLIHPKTNKLTLRNNKSLSETMNEPGYITLFDESILRLLSYSAHKKSRYSFSSYDSLAIHDDIINELFSLLAQAPMVLWEDNMQLTIAPEKAEFIIECVQTANGYIWQPTFNYQNKKQIIKKQDILFFNHKPVIAKFEQSLYRLQNVTDLTTLHPALNLTSFTSEAFKNPQVVNKLLTISQIVPIQLPIDLTKDATLATPIPLLLLNRDVTPWTVEPFMTYGDQRFHTQNTTPILFSNSINNKLCKRDLEKEHVLYQQICTLLKSKEPFRILYEDREYFLHTVLPQIPPDWQIALKNETSAVKRSKADFNFDQTSGINWLDINGTVKIDDSTLALSDILDELLKENPFLTVKGSSYLLSSQDKQKLLQLSAYYDKKEKKVKLSRLHVGALEELEGIVDTSKLHKAWQQTLKAICSFSTLKEAPLPKNFQAKLRPYQQEGVNWLSFLKEYQFGGILADDMGLGKTIQALTILAHSHEDVSVTKPSLIVAPTSVVYNWQEEIKRFTPGLKTYLYMGKERTFLQDKNINIIITSYALLWRDHKQFSNHNFHYVVLDEAHYIKNYKSRTAKTAHLISAEHRLSLTGTPLENNLTELWSQFAFVNPELFSSLEHFKQTFVNPIEKYQNQEVKLHLQRLIKPFLLRRLKKYVLKELPPKIEQTVWCEMEEKQRTLYEAMKQYYQAKILKIVEQKGIKKSQIEILEALLRLRQICCHPDLLKLDERKSYPFLPAKLHNIHSSSKLETVIELLQTAIAEGHKVLLFSQFVSMLNILQTELNKAKISSLMLTGKTKNRQELIETFQTNTSYSVFLLSLKAGGTGLNLTVADYVIHYDPWWNPAVEIQATDRAHRIGQTKSVSVYKILMKDSIEEKIQALQERKKGLIEDIIGGTSHGKGLTREDLEFLLK